MIALCRLSTVFAAAGVFVFSMNARDALAASKYLEIRLHNATHGDYRIEIDIRGEGDRYTRTLGLVVDRIAALSEERQRVRGPFPRGEMTIRASGRDGRVISTAFSWSDGARRGGLPRVAVWIRETGRGPQLEVCEEVVGDALARRASSSCGLAGENP